MRFPVGEGGARWTLRKRKGWRVSRAGGGPTVVFPGQGAGKPRWCTQGRGPPVAESGSGWSDPSPPPTNRHRPSKRYPSARKRESAGQEEGPRGVGDSLLSWASAPDVSAAEEGRTRRRGDPSTTRGDLGGNGGGRRRAGVVTCTPQPPSTRGPGPPPPPTPRPVFVGG